MPEVLIILSCKQEEQPCAEVIEKVNKLSEKYGIRHVTLPLEYSASVKDASMIEIGPYILRGNPSLQQMEIALRAAIDRQKQVEEIHEKRNGRKLKSTYFFGSGKKIALWFNQHYLLIINLLMAAFIAVAFLAPIFMQVGWEKAAFGIYNINKVLCHQLAFRSFFLFGEQIVYPRALAKVNVPVTYEDLMGHTTIDIMEARNYVGDPTHGYKVALCQRDIAMYGSFLFFGVIFAIKNGKVRPIKWWLWILLGLIPIALDGGSQLLGLGFNVTWFPERESTPALRTITGTLFGILTAWYLFPLLAEAIHDKRKDLIKHRDIYSQLKKQE